MQGSLFDSISSIPSFLIDTNTLVPYKCQVPSVQSDQIGGSSPGCLSWPGLNLNVSPVTAKTLSTYFSSFPVQRVMSVPASHRTLGAQEHRCLLPQPTSVLLNCAEYCKTCVWLCLTNQNKIGLISSRVTWVMMTFHIKCILYIFQKILRYFMDHWHGFCV